MVKPGYKQTEVGEIPEDWDVYPLAKVLKIRHGKSQKEVITPDGEYPILATGGEIGRSNIALYSKPSVLIGRKGTIDVPYYMDKPFWTVDTLFYSEVSGAAEAKYLYYKFCLIDWYQYNEASGVPSLSSKTIEKIIQSFPPTRDEQQKISKALSDVDELIVSLEKLIAKKRDIKTATMQQLLTGKKRLLGFGEGKGYKQTELGEIPEDWQLRPIGASFDFKNGLNKEKKYFGYGTPIINYMDVYNNSTLLTSCVAGKVDVSPDELRAYGARKGDVFFTRTSETVEEIGTASVLLDDIDNAVFSGFILRARSSDNFFGLQFRKYCFQSEVVRKQIMATSSYTTRALTNGRLLSLVKVPIPCDHNEQDLIAKILSDMDSEVESLAIQLEKTKDVKQGMMQELLTGRTRLVNVPEDSIEQERLHGT